MTTWNTGNDFLSRAQSRAKEKQQSAQSSKQVENTYTGGSPFAAYKITSGVGARSAPTKGASTNHAGIDRAMPAGTKISLPINTTFYRSGYSKARGNWIEVKDDRGYVLHYQHLSSFNALKPGQKIPAGTVIAKSGNTGVGTGAHLHEEYYDPSGKNVTATYWNSFSEAAPGADSPLGYTPAGGTTQGNVFNTGTNAVANSGFGVFAGRSASPFQRYMQLQNAYTKRQEQRQKRKQMTEQMNAQGLSAAKETPQFIRNGMTERLPTSEENIASSGDWDMMTPFEKYKQLSRIRPKMSEAERQELDANEKYRDKSKVLAADTPQSLYEKQRAAKGAKYEEYAKSADSTKFTEHDEARALKALEKYEMGAGLNSLLLKATSENGAVGKQIRQGAKEANHLYSKYMSENEFKIYKYLIKSGRNKEAENYLKYIHEDVLQRQDESEWEGTYKNIENLSRKNLLAAHGMNALSSLAQIPAYAKTLEAGAATALTGEYHPVSKYDPMMRGARAAKAVSAGRLTDENGKEHGAVRNLFESAGLGVSQSLGAALTGGSGGIYLMAGGAAGAAAYDAIDEGIDPVHAAANATVQGALEYITEKLPFEKMMDAFKMPSGGVKEILAAAAKAGGVEFLEESSNNILGNIAESITLGDRSEFAKRSKSYAESFEEEGYSAKDAAKKGAKQAFFDLYVKETLYSGIVGALSGSAQTAAAGAAGDAMRTASAYRASGIDRAVENLGYQIEYTNDKTYEGMVDRKNNVIYVNSAHKNPFNVIAKHEMSHILEDTPSYKAFCEEIKARLPEEYSAAERKVRDLYERVNAKRAENGEELFSTSDDVIESEAMAEIGEKLKSERYIRSFAFGDDAPFGMQMIEFSRGMAQRLKEKTGTDNGWGKAANLWGRALEEARVNKENQQQGEDKKSSERIAVRSTLAANNDTISQNNDGVNTNIYETDENNTQKYKITQTINNRPVAVISDDILSGVPKKNWVKVTKDTLKNFANGIPISSGMINVIQKTRNEYTNSKYSQRIRAKKKSVYADKLRAAQNIDDVIIASTNYINEGLKHKRKDNIKQFARGNVLMKIGKNKYEAEVLVGITSKNTMLLYDIVGMKPANFTEKQQNTKSVPSAANSIATSQNSGSAASGSGKSTNSHKLSDPDYGSYTDETLPGEMTDEIMLNGQRYIIGKDGIVSVMPGWQQVNQKAKDFTDRLKNDRRKRMKEFKGNKWHAQAKELNIADSIIEQLIRENSGDAPRYYQMRQDMEQLKAQAAYFEKDNASLRQINSYYKKRAQLLLNIFSEIHSENINSLNIKQIASKLKKSCGTHMSEKEIHAELTKQYSKLSRAQFAEDSVKNDSSAEVYSAFVTLAEEMLSDSELENTSMRDQYRELIHKLKIDPIAITKEDAANIADFDLWRKKQSGRVRLSIKGTPIDQYYEQLSGEYPELFSREVSHPADRLLEIARVRDSLDPIKIDQKDLNGAAHDLADEMFASFFSDEMQDAQEVNTSDVLTKNYEKKYGRRIAEKNAEIEFLRHELARNMDFSERLNERVLEADAENVIEETPQEALKETDLTDTLGKEYTPRLINDNAKVINKKSESGAIDVTFLRFNTASKKSLQQNPEYTKIVAATHDKAESGEQNHHMLMRYATNDIYRSFEIFFGKAAGKMKELILDKFDDAKMNYQYMVDYNTNRLYKEVVKGLGISKGSDMSAAVQYYGEWGKTKYAPPEWDKAGQRAKRIYENLTNPEKNDNAAENLAKIKAADAVIRGMYDGNLESINEARRIIYPDAEEKLQKLETMYQKLKSEMDVINVGFLTGDFEGLKSGGTSWSKIEKLAIRQETSEQTLHRMMDIATDNMQELDRKIEEVESRISDAKMNTKSYSKLRERLARLIQKRETYRTITEANENEMLAKIESIKNNIESNAGNLKNGLRERLEWLEARMTEIEEELSSTEISYGRLIPARKNYYHHFRETASALGEMTGFIGEKVRQGQTYKSAAEEYVKKKDGKGIDVRLAGKETSPNAKWQGAFQQRRGDPEITYDAIGGMLRYIPQAAYAATIDPEITIFRTLADDLSQKQSAKDKNTSRALGNFVEYLNLFADDLAGKTSMFDKLVPCEIMPYISRISSRVKKNQIMFNFSSASVQGTNVSHVLPYVQDVQCLAGAAGDLFKMIDSDSKISNEMKKSQFLSERYADPMSKFEHGVAAAGNKIAGTMLEMFDEAGTKYIWAAAYRQGDKLGKDAVRYADDITRKAVAGRGIGEMTLAQRSKVISMFAPFTVENGNAWRIIGDVARQYKRDKEEKGVAITIAKAMRSVMSMWAATWVLNRVMEMIRGSGAGEFDPIEDIRQNLKNRAGVGGALGLLAGDALSSIPGGEFIAQIYPQYGVKLEVGPLDFSTPSREQLFRDNNPTKYGANVLGVFGSAVDNPIYYLLPPAGGAQIKKTYQGTKALLEGAVYSNPDKDGNRKLRYTVQRTPGNIARGVLFGKSAFKEAKEYYNPQQVVIDTKGTKGFNYSKTKKNITVTDGMKKQTVELSGDVLQMYEEARYEEYKKLYAQAQNNRVALKNPYTGAKERREENKNMAKKLTELYEAGAITRQEKNSIYNQYAGGKTVTVSGVEFFAPVKMKMYKDYKDLTWEMKKKYRNEVKNKYEKGELTKAQYEEAWKIVQNGSGEVEVSQYITGAYSSLSDEEKKKITSKLNALATEKAREKFGLD